MQRWFDRKFQPLNTNLSFEGIMERLADAPLRLNSRINGISTDLYTNRIDNAWSIQEQVGHILDLEPLWLGRVHDFQNGSEELRPADLANTKTHQADHNAANMNDLLQRFERERNELVAAFRNLSQQQREQTALHPRLKTPMLPVDLAYFTAEHDDHHLVKITGLAWSLMG